MTTEAERLNEQIALQLDWLKLPQAAALLRSQAVEIEHLKQDLQTEVACVAVKDAEIERLKAEAELFAKHTGLTLAAKDTLLRQALESLVESRDDVLLCFEHDKQFAGHERYDKRIAFYKEQLAKHDASIAAIKQHLGEV